MSSRFLMPFPSIQNFIFLRRLPALILQINVLATRRKIYTSLLRIAKWLFSNLSHFGVLKIS